MGSANLPWPVLAGLVVLAGFLLTFAGAVAGWAIRVQRGENALEIARTATAKAEAVEKELSEFKLEVARNYVSGEAMKAIEQRMVDAIDRLGQRLDKLFEPKGSSRRPTGN